MSLEHSGKFSGFLCFHLQKHRLMSSPQRKKLEIFKAHFATQRLEDLFGRNRLYYFSDDIIWIPYELKRLQIYLCIITRTCARGRRLQSATKDTLASECKWSRLKSDFKKLVRACMQCISTTGGGNVLCPFGPAMHDNKAND